MSENLECFELFDYIRLKPINFILSKLFRKFKMFESKQNQPKLNSGQNRYLMTNPAGLLDAIVTSRVVMEDDLVLRQLEEGIFSILKNGKQIVKYLDKLITEHGCALILYSNRKEHQIIHTLGELGEAC